jgi:hypothetical protein
MDNSPRAVHDVLNMRTISTPYKIHTDSNTPSMRRLARADNEEVVMWFTTLHKKYVATYKCCDTRNASDMRQISFDDILNVIRESRLIYVSGPQKYARGDKFAQLYIVFTPMQRSLRNKSIKSYYIILDSVYIAENMTRISDDIVQWLRYYDAKFMMAVMRHAILGTVKISLTILLYFVATLYLKWDDGEVVYYMSIGLMLILMFVIVAVHRYVTLCDWRPICPNIC